MLPEVQTPELLQLDQPCPPPNRQSKDKLPLLCSRKNPSGQPGLCHMCSKGGSVIAGVVDCIVESVVVVGAVVVVIGTGIQKSGPQWVPPWLWKQPAATQASQSKPLSIQAEGPPAQAQTLELADERPHPGGQLGALTGGIVELRQTSLKVCLSASLTHPSWDTQW